MTVNMEPSSACMEFEHHHGGSAASWRTYGVIPSLYPA